MKALKVNFKHSIVKALAVASLVGASSSALAYPHPVQEALRSCVTAVKKELSLGNYDVIAQEYGVNQQGRKAYDIYLNIDLHDQPGDEATPMKVHCSSEGFGKVRGLELESGVWGYRLGPQDQS